MSYSGICVGGPLAGKYRQCQHHVLFVVVPSSVRITPITDAPIEDTVKTGEYVWSENNSQWEWRG